MNRDKLLDLCTQMDAGTFVGPIGLAKLLRAPHRVRFLPGFKNTETRSRTADG